MVETLSTGMLIFIILVALWSIPWKAVALWKAARRKQKAWYIVLLLINTMAILEILYIYIFAAKKERR